MGMTITEFSFRLFLIFVPGVLSFIIVDALTVHVRTTPFYAVIKSAVLGFLCYLTYYPVSLIFKLPFTFPALVADPKQQVDIVETALSTLMSIPVGLLVSALIYHKLLFKLANRCGISRKISDPGVWSHILSLDPKTVDTQWVAIIDEKSGLLYLGFLQFFSDNNDPEHEYFLRNVDVYHYEHHEQGQLIYQTPALYLNGKRESFKMEFPNAPYLQNPSRRRNTASRKKRRANK
jgi:uncharacterized membrane protein